MKLKLLPELPLLRRELIELANRRRTYVVRFVGAVVMMIIVLTQFSSVFAAIQAAQAGSFRGSLNPNPFRGTGGLAFRAIAPPLFLFVQWVMPALICGSIAMEKERNTLGTLFVTRLSPMTIVLEKLGSRLIPMFTFILLTFPVLAFVYSLGGVDNSLLFGTLWLLFAEALLFASLGLACSAFFSTTVTAFIWSYVLAGLLIVISQEVPILSAATMWQGIFNARDRGGNAGWLNRGTTFGAEEYSTLKRVAMIFFVSLPMLLSSIVLVTLARVFLTRRAFVSSSSILLRIFKRIDKFFTDLNDRTTGGIVLVKDYTSLPAFDPVAWRERAKKSLGKARYLFRILLFLEGPTLFICVAAASSGNGVSSLRFLLMMMWAITTIILAVKSSTMISSERTRETLDALLSTPMTSREIIQQKIDGCGRLMMVLAVPILSIHFTLWLMHVDGMTSFTTLLSGANLSANLGALAYPFLTAASTWLLMHFICWISAFAGIKSSTQPRSVSSAVMLILAWVLGAYFVGRQAREYEMLAPLNWLRLEMSILCNEILLSLTNTSMYGGYELERLQALGPLRRLQDGQARVGAGFVNAVVALVLLGVISMVVRRLVLSRAAAMLKRRDEASVDEFLRPRETTSDNLQSDNSHDNPSTLRESLA